MVAKIWKCKVSGAKVCLNSVAKVCTGLSWSQKSGHAYVRLRKSAHAESLSPKSGYVSGILTRVEIGQNFFFGRFGRNVFLGRSVGRNIKSKPSLVLLSFIFCELTFYDFFQSEFYSSTEIDFGIRYLIVFYCYFCHN